jgi:hypothetical protein
MQVRALKKWIERVRSTKFARDRVFKYNQIRDRIYKVACFREMQSKYRGKKAFSLKLSNMAAKFDNKNI